MEAFRNNFEEIMKRNVSLKCRRQKHSPKWLTRIVREMIRGYISDGNDTDDHENVKNV